MKRVLVLSVLLGLLVLPVFAEHATIDFGGDDSFGFIGDFGDNYAESLDLTWDVIVGIDDYNSFTWSLKGLAVAPAIALDKALTTTDLGMWLGLPVGLKVMWGYDDPDANEFGDVSGYGNQVYDFSPTEYWGVGFLLSASFFEVEVAFDPGLASTDAGRLLAGVAVKEPIPGLNAEVYYFQNEVVDSFEDGAIGVGAAYATDISDISLEAGVSFDYELSDAALVAWMYGLGVAVGYSMFDVTLTLAGMEDEALAGMDFTVDVAPFDMASFYAGAVMSFIDGTDTFQGADLGVNAHVGAVEIYLGYLITENGVGDYNAPETLADGGMYLEFDVDY